MPSLRPLCALDPHFCRARTGASCSVDFYPTVNAAIRHESADSEEDREGLGCHLGQGLRWPCGLISWCLVGNQSYIGLLSFSPETL